MLVPLVEAFALPITVERANVTEASRRICVNTPNAHTRVLAVGGIYISTRHLLFATSLTVIEGCEVSTSQEKRSKRFYYVCLPTLVTHDWASASRYATAKILTFLIIGAKILKNI